MAEGRSTALSAVPDVEIDANGRFKYILIKVIDNSGDGVYKYIVRGFDWAGYHGKLRDIHKLLKIPNFFQSNHCSPNLL